jgi:hypothetical protein
MLARRIISKEHRLPLWDKPDESAVSLKKRLQKIIDRRSSRTW